jgi:hypothetical protein
MEALVPEWTTPSERERAAKVGATAFGWYMKSLPARTRRRALDALKPLKSEIGIFS